MKVVIAGTRTILDYALLQRVVAESGIQDEITVVVSGHATGVDTLGEEWAFANGITIFTMPPLWDLYGKSAGMIRNGEMADYADAAIVVWDGESKGTDNMLSQMKRRRKPVFLWRTDLDYGLWEMNNE